MNLMFGKRRPVAFDADGSWLLATGQPSPDLNCAFLGSSESAQKTLFRFLRRFEKLKVPFLVCMTHDAQEAAAPMADRLGLVSVGELPLMVRNVTGTVDRTNPAIEVRRAGSPEQVRSFQEFASAQFGLPDGVLSEVVPPKSIESGDFAYYLARAGQELAGVGATTRHKEFVGIWSMVTSPERRRVGVARSVLEAMMSEDREADQFFLLATQAGQPFYHAMNFETLDVGHVYAGRFG
jgi:hypothetical protein